MTLDWGTCGSSGNWCSFRGRQSGHPLSQGVQIRAHRSHLGTHCGHFGTSSSSAAGATAASSSAAFLNLIAQAVPEGLDTTDLMLRCSAPS